VTPPLLGPCPALIVVSLFSAISLAHARIQLRHRFAFRFSSIPGARGHLLLGPSPALIVVSVYTPPLRFFSKESAAFIHSERRKGQYLGWRGL
jgi:riboflavin transporter FmnP